MVIKYTVSNGPSVHESANVQSAVCSCTMSWRIPVLPWPYLLQLWEVLGDKVPRSGLFLDEGLSQKTATRNRHATLWEPLRPSTGNQTCPGLTDTPPANLFRSCPRCLHFPLFQGQVKGTFVKASAGNHLTVQTARQVCQQRVRLELLGCLSGRCP